MALGLFFDFHGDVFPVIRRSLLSGALIIRIEPSRECFGTILCSFLNKLGFHNSGRLVW